VVSGKEKTARGLPNELELWRENNSFESNDRKKWRECSSKEAQGLTKGESRAFGGGHRGLG